MADIEQIWPAGDSDMSEMERHFREIIVVLPVAIYMTDAEGRLTYFNPAAVDFSGYEPELGTDQWSMNWKLYYPDGTPMPHDECPMIVALKEERSMNGEEAVAERADGKRIWFEAYSSPLRDDEDEIVGGINMLVDVTEHRQAEKQLRRNEWELADFFENVTIGMHWVGPDGIILRANRAELELLGYSRDEYIGRHIADFHVDKDGVNDIMRRLRAGEEIRNYEARLRRKDGSIRHVHMTSNVLWEHGEFIHTRCFTRDITERKKAEEAMRDLNKTLEKRVEERTATLLSYQDQLRALASELSRSEERERHRLAADLHDNLGQMLAIAKMKLDLLQKRELPDEAASGVAELTALMNDAIRYTRDLMSDLKPPPALDKEDLKTAIDWVAKKMKKHHLEVTVKDDGQPKPLSEEVRTTLRQCVRELLFNVVKHTSVSEAWVVLTRQDDQVQVIVENRGGGLHMEEKKLTPTEEGGFGLFHIQERMDLLGGSLEIISEPGKGTRAILRAPVEDDDKSASSFRQTRQSGSKIRVLLVDDHQMVRKGLQNIIEGQNDLMVIAEASDGREAVELAQETSPDVIVMDVNMPGMNGIDATRQIKAGAPHMHIIGLSLHEEEDMVRAMRDAGASAYVTKAEAFETLCATIRSEAGS